MTEQSKPKYLPDATIANLKKLGLGKATKRVLAAIRCANCPLAKDETFYTYRATQCAGLPGGTMTPIVSRLNELGFLENRRTETDRNSRGGPPRILYDVSEQVRNVIQETEPLPNCIKLPTESVLQVEGDASSLATFRKERGLTIDQMADMLNMSVPRVKAIEENPKKVNLEAVTKYVTELGGEVTIIIDFKGSQDTLKKHYD